MILVATRCNIFDFETLTALGFSMFMVSIGEIVTLGVLMIMFLVRYAASCCDLHNGNDFSRRSKMQDL